MKRIQKLVALALVYALFGLVLSTPALAEEANLVNPALLAGVEMPTTPTVANPAGEKHWTKGGKILTIVGAGIVGVGAIMMTRDNTDISCSGNTCTQINWKATGGLTMGGGAALMIIGLTRKK